MPISKQDFTDTLVECELLPSVAKARSVREGYLQVFTRGRDPMPKAFVKLVEETLPFRSPLVLENYDSPWDWMAYILEYLDKNEVEYGADYDGLGAGDIYADWIFKACMPNGMYYELTDAFDHGFEAGLCRLEDFLRICLGIFPTLTLGRFLKHASSCPVDENVFVNIYSRPFMEDHFPNSYTLLQIWKRLHALALKSPEFVEHATANYGDVSMLDLTGVKVYDITRSFQTTLSNP